MTVKVPLQIFPIGVFVSMQHFAGVKVIQNSGKIGIRQLRDGRQPEGNLWINQVGKSIISLTY